MSASMDAPGGSQRGDRLALVVSPDPDSAELFERVLSGVGFGCLPATDAESALFAVEWEQPSLVLLTLDGDLGDALNLLRALRALPDLPAMPVILCRQGAPPDREALIQFADLGAVELLTLPLRPAELWAAVAKAEQPGATLPLPEEGVDFELCIDLPPADEQPTERAVEEHHEPVGPVPALFARSTVQLLLDTRWAPVDIVAARWPSVQVRSLCRRPEFRERARLSIEFHGELDGASANFIATYIGEVADVSSEPDGNLIELDLEWGHPPAQAISLVRAIEALRPMG